MPQILVGVNQTTMAVLSVVIIAAIIGGFEDIGWEVLSSMRKAAVRPEHALRRGDRAAGHGHRPHHHRLRAQQGAHRGSAAGGWLRGWNFGLSLLAALVIAALIRFAIGSEGTLLPAIEPDQGRGAQPWRARPGARLSPIRRDLQERRALLLHAAAPHRHVRRGDALFLGFRSHPDGHRGSMSPSSLAIAGLLAYRFGWRPALAVVVGGHLLLLRLRRLPLAGLHRAGRRCSPGAWRAGGSPSSPSSACSSSW